MKRTLFLYCLLIFVRSEAQNLVPNWSFEDTIQCPNSMSQLNRTTFWFNPNTASPDYYNVCCSNPISGIPYNAFGFQYARSGVGYTGCYFGGPNLSPSEAREYIEVQLTDSLLIGHKYCVSFYVSRSNNCSYAISNVGAHISSIPLTSTNMFSLPAIPQIENPVGNYLSDSLNWMLISGTYIASGGEKYLTIGNFHDNASTDSISLDSRQYGFYYYYIDDVSVMLCEDTLPISENICFVPNAFSPNGDGNNDFLFVRGKNIDQLSFAVYSRWGEKVFETNDINVGWDGTFRGEKLECAVFAYYLTLTYADGNSEVKKGNVSLIR